ncbi:hypothetical protein [Roseateles amylovorans]|uniref:Bacterial Ig-like domain-containing protein n=1 Tax=Roseateles amylovorans TaxID=2978473 RepID=A0ABY6AWM8_9BURK|nr:hypothetical protein [Roseateles amylovorans]UXH77087.1 hypothetical protein N4261_18980 [Roseateles amylovorans]
MNQPVQAINAAQLASRKTAGRQTSKAVKGNETGLPDAVVSQVDREPSDLFEHNIADAGAPNPPTAPADSAPSSEPDLSLSEPTEATDTSCRKEGQAGDDNQNCGALLPLPWLIGGVGGVAFAAAALGSGSGAAGQQPSLVSPSTVPGRSPSESASSSQPDRSMTPADSAAHPLLQAPRLSTGSGRSTIDPSDHIDVQLTSPGNRWVYRLDNSTVWVTGEGQSIPADAISRGVHAVTVAQIDDQGQIGDIATMAVRVRAPDSSPELALVNDTGMSPTDGLTHDGTISVTGLANDAPWYYRVNGSATWTLGTHAQIPAEALKDGSNVVEVYQQGDDPETVIIKTLVVQLDQTAPDAPVLTTSSAVPVLNASGSVNLSQLEAGGTWEWRVDGGDWHHGQGSALPSTDLLQGSQRVDVRQTDGAGNVSNIQSLDLSVDFSTPGLLSASVMKNSSTVATNNLISANGYLAIGALDPNAHWEFKVGGDDHWRLGTDNGVLSTRYFEEGSNTVLVRQVNEAGNAGAETTVTLKVDTVAPLIEIIPIKEVKFWPASQVVYLNTYSSFKVTSDGQTKVTFAGQTYNIDAGGSAVWIAGYLEPGVNTLMATSTDEAGNVATRTFTLVYDGTPPKAPILSLKNDTGASSTDGITSDGTIQVAGLFTDDQIRYSEDNGLSWSDWSKTREIASSVFGTDGEKYLMVQAQDSSGNIGMSSTIHFTLDSTVL